MGRSHRTFQIITRFWSLVFLAVGLLFLFYPEATGIQLSSWAHLLGLVGTISFPLYNLGFALTLSLMGSVTLLAHECSKHPENRFAYRVLLASKIISTVSFMGLALGEDTAWFICAGGDGFVALTLWWSRRAISKTEIWGLERLYPGKGPHYEVWFGKVDIAPKKALWFRYSLIDGKVQEASTWALLFNEDHVKVGKTVFPLRELSLKHPIFQLKNSSLGESSACGEAGPIRWNLQWTHSGRHHWHGPPIINRLRLAKSRYYSCFFDLRITGEVSIKNEEVDEKIQIKGASGMLGHIEGKKQAVQWAWAHCNHFKGDQNVAFEGLSAQIPIAGKTLPPLSSFVLFFGGKKYSFSSLLQGVRAKSDWKGNIWKFEATNGSLKIIGEATAPGRVAVVEYTDTDASRLWCYNSKLATLKLRLIDPSHNMDRTFEAFGTAAFEIVNRFPPQKPVDL